MTAQNVELRDGGVLTVSAQGDGGAGRIDVEAGGLTSMASTPTAIAPGSSRTRSPARAETRARSTSRSAGSRSATAARSARRRPPISAGCPAACASSRRTSRSRTARTRSAPSRSRSATRATSRSSPRTASSCTTPRSARRPALAGGGNIDIQAGEIDPAATTAPATRDPGQRARRSGAQGGNIRLAAPVVVLDRVGVVANAAAGRSVARSRSSPTRSSCPAAR